MALRKPPTRAALDKAIKKAEQVHRFISRGVADLIVPDKYERLLKEIIDVLKAVRPLA